MRRGEFHQAAQVAEVADAPVSSGAQQIELRGNPHRRLPLLTTGGSRRLRGVNECLADGPGCWGWQTAARWRWLRLQRPWPRIPPLPLSRLLWIGQERTKESFARFFAMIGTQLCEKVEFVCSDMWKPYLEMIALHCPNALNILDRFHIVAKMNKAIDEVRADETRRMSREGYEPVLKKSRWCLLKRRENLTDKQRLRMRDLLQYNLRTVRAWLFKEEFQQLWDYISPVWAGKFLDQWCTEVMRSRIEPMKKFARTVRAHRELILNYFHARKQFSSGVVEGLNNKAKITMRKAYGFRTFRATEIALYHALGKLPEPDVDH